MPPARSSTTCIAIEGSIGQRRIHVVVTHRGVAKRLRVPSCEWSSSGRKWQCQPFLDHGTYRRLRRCAAPCAPHGTRLWFGICCFWKHGRCRRRSISLPVYAPARSGAPTRDSLRKFVRSSAARVDVSPVHRHSRRNGIEGSWVPPLLVRGERCRYLPTGTTHKNPYGNSCTRPGV